MPDYVFSPIDHMHFCKEMKTLLMSDIVNASGLIPPQTLPDHSILQGTFETFETVFAKDMHQNKP